MRNFSLRNFSQYKKDILKKQDLHLLQPVQSADFSGDVGGRGAVGAVDMVDEQGIAHNGTQLFIRGTNLGNWLNPEGYILLTLLP